MEFVFKGHSMKKKTLLMDLDGVLNQYKGEFDKDVIPPPKEGADILLQKLNFDYEVKIFTARDIIMATNWLKKYNLFDYISGVTNIKEPAYIQVDDRCITFDGDYSNLLKKISEFKVWYKS